MSASTGRIFRTLTSEAIRDAMRRRIVPVIAVVSLLSLMLVDGCTSCAEPTVMTDGVSMSMLDVAGWTSFWRWSTMSAP